MNNHCKKCNSIIPTRITIDGRRCSLRNRKYCLDCSPYKKESNGKQYSQWTEERKARHRAVSASKGLKRKKQLIELSGGKCKICGYSKCLRALTFHHRNPEDKCFELNTNEIKSKNWESILDELKKCDLLCVRCHCEIHDKQFEHYIDVQIGTVPGEGQKEFPCSLCGKTRLYRTKSICSKCSKFKKRKITRPPYEVLKEQIKDFGYSGTGRLYGVSDNSIRKWINFYIDHPGRSS